MSNNIVEVVVRATDQFSNVINNLRSNAATAATGISASFTNVGNTLQGVGKNLSTYITAPIAGIGAVALKAGMDFEAGMSSIKALTGATGEEMVKLHDLALEMGEKTKYSATEAAKGMEELLKAGMSVEQVMSGGLNAALSLATAGELQLADAAEIMSTALNAFKADGMSAGDAANILAGCANASATSVGELKFSLAACAAVASGVGLSFADTNAALGVFAQNGLKGSDAGTSLKTMLMNLQPHSKAATVAMEQLGIITADGANQFFTAEGKLKSMGEVAEVLKTSMAGLTDQQRLQVMQTMFGSDAIRAANILFKEGGEGIAKMKEEMAKVTAEEVAKEKMNNLKGSIEQMKGALETAAIKIYETKQGPLKGFVDGLTDLISAFNALDPSTQSFIITAAGIIAAIGPIIVIVGSLCSAIGSIITAFTAVSACFAAGGIAAGVFGGALTLLTGPVGLAIAAIAGIVAVGYLVYDNWEMISNFAGEVWDGICEIVNSALELLTQYVMNWTLPGLIYQHWDDIKEYTSQAWEAIKTLLINYWSALGDYIMNWTLPGLIYQHWDAIKEYTSQAWTAISDFLTGIWNTIKETAVTIWSAYLEYLTTVFTTIQNTIVTIWTAIFDFLSETWNNISNNTQEVWTTISTFLTDTWTSISSLFTDSTTNISTLMSETWNTISTVTQETWTTISTFLTDTWTSITTALTEWLNNFINSMQQTWDTIVAAIEDRWNAILNFFTEIWNSITTTGQEWLNNLVSMFSVTWEDVFQGVQTAWNAICTWLVDTWNNVLAKAAEIWAKIKAIMTGNAEEASVGVVGSYRQMEEQSIASMTNTQREAVTLSTAQQVQVSEQAKITKNNIVNTQSTIKNSTNSFHAEQLNSATNHYNGVNSMIAQKQEERLNNLTTFNDREQSEITQVNDYIEQNYRTTWENINSNAETAFSTLESTTSQTFNNIKTTIGTNLETTKTTATANLEELKNKAKTIWTTMEGDAKKTFEDLNNKAGISFNDLKKIITDPVGWAKDQVKAYLDQILRKVLDFKWPQFPELSIPVSVRQTSSGGGGLFGKIGNLIGNIFGFAKGGDYPGGLALVGEEGPEIINFNRGGHVSTASETASMLNNRGTGSGITIESLTINANSESEGRNAAIGFAAQMQKLGYKTRGV